ncbi:MAG TPA: 30S ribosomal protein S16 [Vicinamibacterales bacterium]|jgi:small subunit ribosomal protein S16|nr:30S ribosomal protein S16 [Vicinamibacterales bacterium]
MVTIRLTRVGSKKRPFFRIVVVEGRTPLAGSVVESVGLYDPRRKPQEFFQLDRDRYTHWVSKGAKPSSTLKTLVARNPAPASPEAAAAAPAAS